MKTTTEVETESSGSANAGSKARGGRQPAAAARPLITKIINKNNDLNTINMGLTPLSSPQHPNHNILSLPDTNNIHPCTPNHNILPLPDTNNIHPCSPNTNNIHPCTPTTTSQPNFLDPEKTCDVRGNGSASGSSSGSGNGGANDGKNINLYSLLFSVGRTDDTEEEEEKRSAPRRTKEEVRRRKDLVAQARSRRLKVGSKSSHEIQTMPTKDKRTQPRVTDILLRQEEEKKKKKEEPKEAEEEEEEAIASRKGGTVAKPKTSDNEVDITERREGHCMEPGEEGGGGIPIPKPNPNPISIMPKAKEGETNQEGGGRRSNLGVGKRNLGPIPNNVKPNPSQGEPVEEECQPSSSN